MILMSKLKSAFNNLFLRKTLCLWVILVLVFSYTITAAAQEPLAGKQANAVLERVVKSYSNWGSVELNGKFRCSLLPISATVKIYMKKDKEIMASVRAPFVGEVARVEVAEDSVLIVNKMKRKYCKVATSSLNKVSPGILPDAQSLALGRLTLLGVGQLSRLYFNSVSVYDDSNCGYIILPSDKLMPEKGQYGYTVNNDGQLTSLMALAYNSDVCAAAEYSYYSDGGFEIDFQVTGLRKNIDASLSLSAPKWGASPMEPFEVTSRYTRTSFKNTLKF